MTMEKNAPEAASRIWLLGDNVDTDLILPSQYVTLLNLREKASHCLESVLPGFAATVKEGDVLVGKKNFGCGSSREQAPQVLRELKVKAVIAKSFARIFFRNCINLGLPVIECPDYCDSARQDDRIEIFISEGRIFSEREQKNYYFQPFPEFLNRIIKSGGLANHIYRKTHSQQASK